MLIFYNKNFILRVNHNFWNTIYQMNWKHIAKEKEAAKKAEAEKAAKAAEAQRIKAKAKRKPAAERKHQSKVHDTANIWCMHFL